MKWPPTPVLVRLAVTLGAAIGAAAMVGRTTGWRRPLVAVALHAGLMRWAVDALPALCPELRGGWFRVRDWEPRVYRRVGVYVYMRGLRVLGWEAFRRSAVGFAGRRAELARLERATREAETNHAVLGALGVTLAVLAARRRWWDAALWQLLLTALLHAYPVMLQRTLRARLARLQRP
ncbi:hypothetical protein HNQ07_001293 [Deinococcus metalli]|uniref:Glycosyl-4,4'-diaponeurosporenoate acyltransferase n=1 Tax=Deinococcus metalli TaxID=1141878 RepID=A0A7W8KCZ6_9DEIO|nr:hypothetical protein [Deinococcus metalli]MBB5375836.1 hypothetical protein [Deinococcus metalli]GHF36679.1 hypothetical protein GCM10017781_11670 [Deinococcus metalli]